jgi:hypothetical protein
MSDRPIRVEVNCLTGDQTIIELTDEEIAALEAEQVQAQAREAEQQAQAEALSALKASAKAKLIAGEALTAEEAELLI